MVQNKDKSLEEYLLHPDMKKALLPAIAIYGANAAGKSNVLHAMMNMREMVVGEAAKASKGLFPEKMVCMSSVKMSTNRLY